MADGGYEWCETLASCVRPWEVPRGLCPGFQQENPDNNSASGSGSSGDEAGLGLIGLWFGMAAGYAVVALIGGIAVLRSDWEQIVAAAAERSAAKTKSTTAGPPPVVSPPPLRSLNRPDPDDRPRWGSFESSLSNGACARAASESKGLGASLLLSTEGPAGDDQHSPS